MNAATKTSAKPATFHKTFKCDTKTCWGGLFAGHEYEIQITVPERGDGFWEIVKVPQTSTGYRARFASGVFSDMDDPAEIMAHISGECPEPFGF